MRAFIRTDAKASSLLVPWAGLLRRYAARAQGMRRFGLFSASPGSRSGASKIFLRRWRRRVCVACAASGETPLRSPRRAAKKQAPFGLRRCAACGAIASLGLRRLVNLCVGREGKASFAPPGKRGFDLPSGAIVYNREPEGLDVSSALTTRLRRPFKPPAQIAFGDLKY